MRNTSASANPIWRAGGSPAAPLSEARDDDRQKDDIVDAETIFSAVMVNNAPMRPGWSAARSCAERSHEPDPHISARHIGRDHNKALLLRYRADIEIVYQHDDVEHTAQTASKTR